ncbi:hypothetical protein MMC17_000315 [Xylographa soralifera]|nr:hypothetical protein [Xylographa soralifera]
MIAVTRAIFPYVAGKGDGPTFGIDIDLDVQEKIDMQAEAGNDIVGAEINVEAAILRSGFTRIVEADRRGILEQEIRSEFGTEHNSQADKELMKRVIVSCELLYLANVDA